KLYRELKKENITHVADFHNVLRSKILRTLFIFDGKPCMFIDKGRAEKKALTRAKNKIFKQLKTSHQRYADVLNKLGFTLDLSNPTQINKKKLSKKITLFTGLKEDTWIGIAPFAAFKGKIYPLQLMEEVIKEMDSKGFKIFLFGGGKREIEILNSIENTYKNVINLAGHLSFKEELEVIGELDLMVSMDSGNAHLAAMQHVKTITLWGVTHPYAGFAPFHQPYDYCVISDLKKYPKIPCSIYGNKVINGYENAMETISPAKVIEKIMYVLNK
ncbi:MAG: glycosyltransferase family 9 protein, partial [Flavobacteriaceae bacterium]|nr:glycosyltransferase family 9 protein [Flavobacteriaceae bacterium]